MSSEESNKMSPKKPSQDSNSKKEQQEESLRAYREAAMADDYLFGDYDAYESYGINREE